MNTPQTNQEAVTIASLQPTGIQIHLTTGHCPMFYQDNPDAVALACADLDSRIFTRSSLIIESKDSVTAFPGHALVGITILTSPLPATFLERERASKTIISEISQESFDTRRLNPQTKVQGVRSPVLCELHFTGGEHQYMEFSEIAENGIDERSSMHHLFSNPSLSCRRLEGGFSIWNTAHIVSWSHYPKLEAPQNAWRAEALSAPAKASALLAGTYGG